MSKNIQNIGIKSSILPKKELNKPEKIILSSKSQEKKGVIITIKINFKRNQNLDSIMFFII